MESLSLFFFTSSFLMVVQVGGGRGRRGGIVSQPIDIYLNPIKSKYILKSGHSLHFHDLLLKDPFSLPPFFVCGCGCCGCCMGVA